MNEISLWLDAYEDIYSDFDSRHYLKRRLSEDFIDELKTSLRYKSEHADTLMLLLPPDQRNLTIETEIPISIREQLYERLEILSKKANKIKRRGLLLVATGMLVMVTDSILTYKAHSAYFSIFLRIMMEPAGWFMISNGLDLLIAKYRAIKKEVDFYDLTHRLKVHFKDA